MKLRIIERLENYFSIDPDYRLNKKYLDKNALNNEYRQHLTQINSLRVLILTTFGILYTAFITIIDYIPNFSTTDKTILNVYKVLDPLFFIFILTVNILLRIARSHNNILLLKNLILIYFIVTIINYSMVSSLEQYDVHNHPSFIMAFSILALLIYISPTVHLIMFIAGFAILFFFHQLFDIKESLHNVMYTITIFIGPISFIIAKINYNTTLRIFVKDDKRKKLANSLEIQVRQRTVELQEANEKLMAQIEMQKEYEASLKEAKEKAEQSDRLKSSFLSNLSHEIRTPLNSVIGFSSLMNKPGLEAEKTKRYTSLINSCGKELVFIIDQLVEISRIESGEIELNKSFFYVNDLLSEMQERTLERLRDLHKEHVQFSVKNPSNKLNIRIYSDIIKIKLILHNLLENSIKFTESGMIQLGFSNEIQNCYIFSVSDTGIGISEENKEKLFEQFVQGETGFTRRYGGLGLGLSISKAYAQFLDGTIRFNSEKGKGSIFYLSINI